MTITLIALGIYFIFVLAFAIFSAFGIYHLWQFGYAGDLCRPAAISYLTVSGAVILFTIILVLISILGS